jgi:hypothetical protein
LSIELTSIHPKTPRRLVVSFSNTLAAAAFGVAPIYYVLTELSVEAAPVYVKAALVVPGQGNQVELALSDDLLPGARYQFTAFGVPAADASTTIVATVRSNSHSYSYANNVAPGASGSVISYGTQYFLTCNVGGVTGATEPDYTNIVYGEQGAQYIVDGGVTWELLTSIPLTTCVQIFSYRNLTTPVNVEQNQDQSGAVLFGTDLVWTGSDFLQNASGDLSIVVGTTNVLAALGRRVLSDGLPYDPSYGAKPRSYVDAPTSTMGNLRATVLGQLTADPRVVSADVAFLPDAITNTEVTFTPMVKLVGDQTPRPLSVSVSR